MMTTRTGNSQTQPTRVSVKYWSSMRSTAIIRAALPSVNRIIILKRRLSCWILLCRMVTQSHPIKLIRDSPMRVANLFPLRLITRPVYKPGARDNSSCSYSNRICRCRYSHHIWSGHKPKMTRRRMQAVFCEGARDWKTRDLVQWAKGICWQENYLIFRRTDRKIPEKHWKI